jgi:hypothetical protein
MSAQQLQFRPKLMVLAAISIGCVALEARDTSYHPAIDPAEFSAIVDNPYFPLVPGTTFHYLEKSRFETVTTTFTVTHEKRRVMGVDCVVVHDVAMLDGRISEDTYDWFAQRKDGSVWYFGEETKEISPGGKVSTLGSWEAGVDDALPGLIMSAAPEPGKPYRQEYLAGVAEDMAQVVALGEVVTSPLGTYRDTVKTRDWSMLEPGNEFKWYARGIGVVKETGTAGEIVTLESIGHE